MIQPVQIGNRLVGPGQPCFIIAEVGVNHNGDLNLAYKMVDIALQAGVDAVKFQSFITEELITLNAPKASYQLETTGQSNSQYMMLKALELTSIQHNMLKQYCADKGIVYLCTPYEHTSVDMLDVLDVTAYKIASTDINNLPFLQYIATKNRPVILSTGMSTLGEIEQAIGVLYSGGLKGKIILLHCTSEYPAPIEEVNLCAILTMQQAFGCPIGFSDHTVGLGASPWAVAIGACIIEKHFTLDRSMDGPDHRASLEPTELKELVHTVRQVEVALGNGVKRPMPSELTNKPLMQKSLVARRAIQAGSVITVNDLTCKRPGFGLAPSWFETVIGKRAARDIPEDTLITLSSVDWSGS